MPLQNTHHPRNYNGPWNFVTLKFFLSYIANFIKSPRPCLQTIGRGLLTANNKSKINYL